MFLVENCCKDSKYLPLSETHKLFSDAKDAVVFAKSIGYSDFFGMGINVRDGFVNEWQCGDVHVKIFSLAVDEGITK